MLGRKRRQRSCVVLFQQRPCDGGQGVRRRLAGHDLVVSRLVAWDLVN